MGFAASQARYLMLSARMNDLDMNAQFINQARLSLANVSSTLSQLGANLEPGSPQMAALQARIQGIAAIDRNLEVNLQRLDIQREAVRTEIDAVRKVVQKNIASTFKTFG